MFLQLTNYFLPEIGICYFIHLLYIFNFKLSLSSNIKVQFEMNESYIQERRTLLKTI